MMDSDILTAQEAAQYLKLPRNTLYAYARTRIVPGVKLGKAWRFKRSEIDQLLRRECHTHGDTETAT